MKTYSYAIVASLLGVAALTLPGSARAATIETTLDTLLPGGANQAGRANGDKFYSNFRFSSPGPVPINASAVRVSLISDDAANQYQIRFTFAQDALDVTAGQRTDVVIGYQINVIGAQLINGVGLAFDGTVTGGNGNAAATITETIRTIDGTELSPAFPDMNEAFITVYNDGLAGRTDNNTMALAVHPTQALEFEKDILVSSAAGGGRVEITTVDNFVNQIPEPSSAALLGASGSLLLARRRRGR
jgi:hypothetical protein